LNDRKEKQMLPIPKEHTEEEKKGIRELACPYCCDSPFVRPLTPEGLAEANKH
jgi:hypothetical protein